MCDSCGCGNTEGIVLRKPGAKTPVADIHHEHGNNRKPGKAILDIQADVLGANNAIAAHNREHFNEHRMLAINLMSSPGSGKTTLLEHTINALFSEYNWSIVEGDQQTTLDADRIHATGASTIQVNTGTGCHLDAQMIHSALHAIKPVAGSIVVIENVGNLVCPALFDLGENYRVIIMSTTEGDDKPLKYPTILERADLCLINKVDLLPYLDFDLEVFKSNARKVNPRLSFFALSATTGVGMPEWFNWISQRYTELQNS